MGRVLLGAVAAAVAMFVIGAIFYATPLVGFGQGTVPDPNAAEVQRALAANLPETGTYQVPSAGTPAQTVMYGQGPIATIHYNTDGFATFDPGTMLVGFLLYVIVSFFLAAGLWTIERQVRDFGDRARVVVAVVVAAVGYVQFKMPLWYHHDWGNAFYFFLADSATLIAGGLIVARWFLPRPRVETAEV